ncbi:vitamin B12 dependent-methionine synthase activation domain-containing protein [Bacteroides helcogenes]|uniref:Methionine synthase (B12-dependent) n=1 Tax=Bacteroides helcogenes (strain ATCC 35417 / DSM 20613 / JCM 6297 / CCUG 15421 / P 36-108) TaxID=693979 RepID=E6SP96_BACT6|nr:vitamin B12 dependent-methionine synthase activation domain-containing protein [Bacteroides helcogenes]ADV44853.1 methionine synthase (B12-dependent) [Bacteroides helcogenes P 36-108]MDY5239710.1 vitamin B12 dependent-methionine synthase activation domain-containing protein [Bacteroides helcogenes]
MINHSQSSVLRYSVHEVASYINWIYFFHAWGFQPRFAAIADIHGCDACRAMWLYSFPEEERAKAAEAMQLFKEANRMLDQLDKDTNIRCVFKLCNANGDGDNLIIEGTTFPLLRQQTPNPDGSPFLCLSDFVRPLSSGISDVVGLFASSIGAEAEEYYRDDPYKHLLVQTLNDRLAEAATEKMHEYVRKEAWGYAPEESLSIPDLLVEKYQGIRPAVGYPSLPDQSVNFLLDELLDMRQIGITLTENGAMHPHASVCGLMLAHPASRYFAVGRIGEDQVEDYARRRGMSVNKMRKFLAANLPK